MDNNIAKTRQMESENIFRLIMRFSATSFCSLLFDALYNIVDTLFVGRGVGNDAMGGVSIIMPFMLIQSAIAQMVGGGAASIVSRLLGKGAYEKAGSVTANAMAFFYITAVMVSVTGFAFMSPILRLLGATDDILPYAKEYFTVMLIGNVFSTGFSSIIRAEGRVRYSLLIWLIPTLVNIVLDAVFIYGLDMGVTGAALATVTCYFTSFTMMVIFFKKYSCQKFTRIKISLKTCGRILTLGIHTLLQIGGISVLFLIINNLISKTDGTNGINTFAYLSRIITFAIVPFNAISQAISPIISYNWGAGNDSRVKSAVKISMILCEIYAILAMILGIYESHLFIKLFTDDANILSAGSNAVKIISAALPFVPLTVITGSYFQAVGKRAASISTYLSILVFLILFAMILSNRYGLNGVWISIPLACALSAMAAVILLTVHKKKQNKLS